MWKVIVIIQHITGIILCVYRGLTAITVGLFYYNGLKEEEQLQIDQEKKEIWGKARENRGGDGGTTSS